MSMAVRLRWFLDTRGISYETLPHPHSSSSLETAREANVPGDKLAKSVILEDERGYVMAILPASCRIALADLQRALHRKLELASEEELGQLFKDCEVGAVPPIADPYGIPAVVDDRMLSVDDVFFEAGDHEDIIHLSGEAFLELQKNATHGSFSRPI